MSGYATTSYPLPRTGLRAGARLAAARTGGAIALIGAMVPGESGHRKVPSSRIHRSGTRANAGDTSARPSKTARKNISGDRVPTAIGGDGRDGQITYLGRTYDDMMNAAGSVCRRSR